MVGFEVDQLNRALHRGWSVSVTGRATLLTDPVEQAWASVDGPEPWVGGPKDALVRIPLTIVTGRWLGPRDRDAADQHGRASWCATV